MSMCFSKVEGIKKVRLGQCLLGRNSGHALEKNGAPLSFPDFGLNDALICDFSVVYRQHRCHRGVMLVTEMVVGARPVQAAIRITSHQLAYLRSFAAMEACWGTFLPSRSAFGH